MVNDERGSKKSGDGLNVDLLFTGFKLILLVTKFHFHNSFKLLKSLGKMAKKQYGKTDA